MVLIPENERVEVLRSWGISEPLIRLSSGEVLHEEFRYSDLGPPWYVYHGSVVVPQGLPFAPLWEYAEQVTGVRRRDEGLEFVQYGFDQQDAFTVLSRTEQGFWATRFDRLYEGDVSFEVLRAAALVAGFRFLEKLLSSRDAAETKSQLGTFEGHNAWLKKLVEDIDQIPTEQ
jgi:hypothetical protein